MPHIHFKHGYVDRVINTDQIVTVAYDDAVQSKPLVFIVTTTNNEYRLVGDNADEFWAKYQRLCVAQQRPEVG